MPRYLPNVSTSLIPRPYSISFLSIAYICPLYSPSVLPLDLCRRYRGRLLYQTKVDPSQESQFFRQSIQTVEERLPLVISSLALRSPRQNTIAYYLYLEAEVRYQQLIVVLYSTLYIRIGNAIPYYLCQEVEVRQRQPAAILSLASYTFREDIIASCPCQGLDARQQQRLRISIYALVLVEQESRILSYLKGPQ